MIHTPNTLTLSKYALFEQSKDLRLLFRHYVPKWYALKHSGKFIESFNKLFNAEAENDLDNELYKLLEQNKIMLMQAILLGIQTHLGEKIELEMLKPGYNAHLFNDYVLVNYLNEAGLVMGSPIENIDGVIDFKNELERKIDKYKEMYPEKKVKSNGVTMLQLAYGVFSLMNMQPNLELTLSQFAELKKLADVRAKQMQELTSKTRE